MSYNRWGYFIDRSEAKLLTKNLNVIAFRKLIKANRSIVNFVGMPSKDKFSLLESDFVFYSKLIEISSLVQGDLIKLALRKPTQVLKYVDWSIISGPNKSKIAVARPTWFKKHKIPLDNIDDEAWVRLLKNNPKLYIPKFLDEMPTMRNKTKIRKVFYNMPVLFQLVTVDTLEASPLTAKEWILIINSKWFNNIDIKYSDEVKEWLEDEVLANVLAGNAKTSRVLTKAREKLNG